MEHYLVMVSNAKEYLYGSGEQQVLEQLSGGEDIAMEAAKITVDLMKQLLGTAQEAGKQIEPGILFEVAADIVNEQFNIAMANGVWEPTSDKDAEETQSKALVYAAKMYAEEMAQNGEGDPQAIEQMVNDIMGGKYDDVQGGQPGQGEAPPSQPQAGLITGGIPNG